MKHSIPEIQIVSMEKIILRIKQLNNHFDFLYNPFTILNLGIDIPSLNKIQSSFFNLLNSNCLNVKNERSKELQFIKAKINVFGEISL